MYEYLDGALEETEDFKLLYYNPRGDERTIETHLTDANSAFNFERLFAEGKMDLAAVSVLSVVNILITIYLPQLSGSFSVLSIS